MDKLILSDSQNKIIFDSFYFSKIQVIKLIIIRKVLDFSRMIRQFLFILINKEKIKIKNLIIFNYFYLVKGI